MIIVVAGYKLTAFPIPNRLYWRGSPLDNKIFKKERAIIFRSFAKNQIRGCSLVINFERFKTV